MVYVIPETRHTIRIGIIVHNTYILATRQCIKVYKYMKFYPLHELPNEYDHSNTNLLK